MEFIKHLTVLEFFIIVSSFCVLMCILSLIMLHRLHRVKDQNSKFVRANAYNCLEYGAVLIFFNYSIAQITASSIQSIYGSILQVIAFFIFLLSVFILLKILLMIFGLKKLKDFSNLHYTIILTIFLIEFLAAFSSIHYCVYSIHRSWYDIPDGINAFKLAFEFFYYEFNTTITLGGSNSEIIKLTGVIPKSIQMFNIAVFYGYLANLIYNLKQIDKKTFTVKGNNRK